MRILLTNLVLSDGSGTETLIRDLSLALRRRRHAVICFAPALGRVAAQIRATGTPVVIPSRRWPRRLTLFTDTTAGQP